MGNDYIEEGTGEEETGCCVREEEETEGRRARLIYRRDTKASTKANGEYSVGVITITQQHDEVCRTVKTITVH